MLSEPRKETIQRPDPAPIRPLVGTRIRAGTREGAERENEMFCTGWWYWFIRKVLAKVSVTFKQQCSGKQQVGHAVEWCQKRAFHDGVCVSWAGREFSRPMDEISKQP